MFYVDRQQMVPLHWKWLLCYNTATMAWPPHTWVPASGSASFVLCSGGLMEVNTVF